jgi:ring-1,2-phenylacetyl-CoA epoxidase subunit PaaD
VTTAAAVARDRAWRVAAEVPDPELPMVTLADLGILREVCVEGSAVVVSITPTYTGCPALHEMHQDLRHRLERAGFYPVTIRTELAPPWSSDWITGAGRTKLASAGIAAPNPAPTRLTGPIPLTLAPRHRTVACPRCGSPDTRETSAFGSTACRALYRCGACAEPFDYIKEI